MRDLGIREAALDVGGEGAQDGVGVEAGGTVEVHGRVQPAEERFAFGVKFVIDFHRPAGLLLGFGNTGKPRIEAAIFAHGNIEDFGFREFGGQPRDQALEPVRRQEIIFRDDDEVGLLELFSEDIEHLVGKLFFACQAEDLFGADRIDEHAERRDGELLAIHASQRIRDRRDKIGAAPDRLGDEGVRQCCLRELGRGIDERIEAAAKTAAWNFLGREAFRPQHRGVHEIAALVVRDEPDAQAARGEALRERGDGGRFSGAEEAADHDVARARSRLRVGS